MSTKKALILMIVAAAFVFTGCSGKNVMPERDVFKMPEKERKMSEASVKQDANASQALKLDKQDLGEDAQADFGHEQIDRAPYNVIWVPMHPVLVRSEGRFGLCHEIYLREQDIGDNELSDTAIKATKVVRNNRVYLMVVDFGDLDLSKKAYISSRSGKHQYGLNGEKHFGVYADQFSWKKLSSFEEATNVEIWKNVEPNSDRDQEVVNNLSAMAKRIDNLYIPDLYERLLKKIGKITKQDLMIGAATDFHGLFAVVGIRAWAIVEAIVGEADLSLPYYDTATVTRYQLARELEGLETGSARDKEAMETWLQEMKEYQERKKQYEERYGQYLAD
jgi:6-pyruvoyl-tetrahydropterin synthase